MILQPTKEETTQLRGIAILCIILYNFIRQLLGIDGNEMHWDDANVAMLHDGVKSAMAPLYIISYLGWYGVPIFLFLSGFGLSLKYIGGGKEVSTPNFVKSHIQKLLTLMIPAYILYLCIHIGIFNIPYPSSLIVKQFTLTANFLSSYMNPGVYWFFGLMAQFYLIFLIVRKWDKTKLAVVLALSVVLDYIVLYAIDDKIMMLIRHNSVGWLSSFLLGMLFAKIEDIKINHYIGIGLFLFLAFIISSLIKWLHPLSPLLFITTLLIFIKHKNNAALMFVGALSSCLFAIHPLTRLVLYNEFTNHHLLTRIAIYIISTFVFAYLYSKLQKYLSSKLKRKKITVSAKS